MIPYLCPQLPERQKEALQICGQGAARLYKRSADRTGGRSKRLGISQVHSPGQLSFRASAQSGHRYRRIPHAALAGPSRCWSTWCAHPATPGLPERDQHRAGRSKLLTTSFATFEAQDPRPARRACSAAAGSIRRATSRRSPSIAGRTAMPTNTTRCSIRTGRRVRAPHEIGRARFGRIAIANSDAAAAAYTDSAIDQAHRAVQELLQN